MANPNGKKGSAFERAIADCLSAHLEQLDDPRDRTIDRRVKTGSQDRGDVGGVRAMGQRLVVECKNVHRFRLAEWVTEAEVERGNDDAIAGVVVHKRPGHGDPLDQYVSGTVRDLIAIITGTRP